MGERETEDVMVGVGDGLIDNLGSLTVKALAVAGGAAVAGLVVGAVVGLFIRKMFRKPPPPAVHTLVRILGGIAGGLAVALLLFTGVGGGGWGPGGGGTGVSNSRGDLTPTHSATTRTATIAAIEPPSEPAPRKVQSVRVIMLGGDLVRNGAAYRIEGERQPRTLTDLQQVIRQGITAAPPTIAIDIVVYDNSVARGSAPVVDLEALGRAERPDGHCRRDAWRHSALTPQVTVQDDRMASPPPPTAAPPALDPKAVRIVLFGMPGAGKSSLLGALAQAAQSQERTLGGRLIDLTSELADLQHRVYEGRPEATTEEIVPYAVAFDRLDGMLPDPERRESAVLVDCDGRVASDLLAGRFLAEDLPETGLAGAIGTADALILVVDIAAGPAQVDIDLAEFVRFLRLFRQHRGQRTAVGCLPVYLVLSKCDLIAEPNDTLATWQVRVNARRAEVEERFREFIAEDAAAEAIPFGAIDLELAATAVKSLGRPREPWGVAELFRSVLTDAQAFHDRRERSASRLAWTVVGSLLILGGLIAFGGGVLLNRPTLQRSELATKVQSYRAREGQTPSVRLTEPLQRKIGELSDLTSDPGFNDLPADSQEYVKAHLAELEAYRAYKEGLAQVRTPVEARTLDDLSEIERGRSKRKCLLPHRGTNGGRLTPFSCMTSGSTISRRCARPRSKSRTGTAG